MDTSQKLTDVIRTIKSSVRPFKGAGESKSVYLKIDYSECTLEDILSFASADRRIAWANGGSGRKAYDDITDGDTIDVKASSPGAKPPIDPQIAMENRLKQMTPEAQAKWFADMRAKIIKGEK